MIVGGSFTVHFVTPLRLGKREWRMVMCPQCKGKGSYSSPHVVTHVTCDECRVGMLNETQMRKYNYGYLI